MARLFASGRVADLIVAFMLLELGVLTLVHRRARRGAPPAELAASLGAGAALVLALRAALTAEPWPHVALWLAAALAAHAIYVRMRWGATRPS